MRLLALALALASLAGCSDDKPQETEALTKTCTEGGAKHASGTSWTCADGCNTCSCADNGQISTTLRDCVDADTLQVDSNVPADTSEPADTSAADATDAADGG